MTAEPTASPSATNRTCGSCQLCCRLVPVAEIGKPANTRCRAQRHGKGCAVYRKPLMPVSCAMWSCRWLVGTFNGRRPDHAHYVVDMMPDYVTAQDNATKAEQHIPVVQVWVDPAHRDAHHDTALRAWLDETRQAAIVRFNSGDGFVLFPPSMSDDGEWHEIGGSVRVDSHSLLDVAARTGATVDFGNRGLVIAMREDRR